MSETERNIPFCVELLVYLVPSFIMGLLVIYLFTVEFSIVILAFAIADAFLIGVIWTTLRKYKSKLRKKGVLGYLLLLISNFINEWIWIRLCLGFLGSGLLIYDMSVRENSET
jgi:uncharacterized membrane protein